VFSGVSCCTGVACGLQCRRGVHVHIHSHRPLFFSSAEVCRFNVACCSGVAVLQWRSALHCVAAATRCIAVVSRVAVLQCVAVAKRGTCLYSVALREVGGWGRAPFSRNLMSPTPRRK